MTKTLFTGMLNISHLPEIPVTCLRYTESLIVTAWIDRLSWVLAPVQGKDVLPYIVLDKAVFFSAERY